jgi:hypothetical protein
VSDQQWSYFSLRMLNLKLSLGNLDSALNELGADGWELVTSVALQKWAALIGNEVIFVFKKAGAGHRPPKKFLGLEGVPDNYAEAPY